MRQWSPDAAGFQAQEVAHYGTKDDSASLHQAPPHDADYHYVLRLHRERKEAASLLPSVDETFGETAMGQKCIQCGSTDTIGFHKQDRSSDEPGTDRRRCLTCNAQWRISKS
jgi:DNA-directed RNA polymerase subunit M/transcription elongation factor TFIIS